MNPDEYGSIRAVAVAAFDDVAIGALLDDLRESWAWEDQLSFVADIDDDVVAHVSYTHAFVDAPRRLVDVLVLAPVSVAPKWQGQGVGGRLITESLNVLGQRAEPLVFLEGHPEYYPRFGFERAAEHGFIAPSRRIPDAAFMVYRLPRHESWMKGALVYSDAFWRHDAVGLRPDA